MATLKEWLADRFGWWPVHDSFIDRRVPKTPWYYGDGATLLALVGVLVLTGALLTLTYSPSPDTAYQSVEYITARQTLGWFIRGLHYWAAGLAVVMAFFHLLRVVLVAGYKAPREGTWLAGVFLFFLILTMSYLGYLLRWDERSVYAFRVGVTMLGRLPLIGDALVMAAQGGQQISALTLSRMYSAHILWLPLAILAAVSLHFYLIVLHGVTSRLERGRMVHGAEHQREIYREVEESEDSEPFYPDATVKSGAMVGTVLLLAGVLAIVVGAPALFPEANLVRPSMPIEEWWFWWYSALIALLPPAVAPWFVVAFPLAAFLALAALPLVDRSPYRGIKNRPWWALAVALVVVTLLALSDLRRRSPWTGWPDPDPPPVPARVSLAPEAELGRRLFAQHGCTSCHAIAGHGRQVGPDLARIEHRFSQEELREFIRQPPDGVPMPAYKDRLSKSDLDRIVAFVLVAQTFPRTR